MNAIIHASRDQMLDATLYLACLDAKTGKREGGVRPCKLCSRVIINAGIKWVVAEDEDLRIIRYSVADWVQNDRGEWNEENSHGY